MTNKKRLGLRKIEKNSLIVYICKIRFKWPEMKSYLNIAPHSNTQFIRVECSVHPCVSTHLLRGNTEKETVEKPEKAFYEKRAAQLNNCILHGFASLNFKTAAVQVISFNYNLFMNSRAMIYFVLTAF